MNYQIIYILMYFTFSALGLGIGFGFIPWAKKGTKPSGSSDRLMKKAMKITGISLGLLFLIKIMEYFQWL